MDLSLISNFAFVREASVLIQEHTGESLSDDVEDTATHYISPLPREQAVSEDRQETIVLYEYPFEDDPTIRFEGAFLQLQYVASHGVIPW